MRFREYKIKHYFLGAGDVPDSSATARPRHSNRPKKEKGEGSRLQREVVGGTSLAVQSLRLCSSNAGDEDSIPGAGTKRCNGSPHFLGE